MKVIFISDAESVGKIGEVREVKDGFARNYLLPKKIAVEATPENIKIWERKRQILRKKEESLKAEAETLAAKLREVACTIPVKVGEEDRLFGSVTSQNISDALKGQGFEISRKDIELDSPIKTLGTYEVPIKLHSDVTANIKVEVIKEEE
ncbi:MAG TPA: 50S ribosomal protein L9 [Thermodesulfobacteriota bacterium]|nr:50S ribosomal protein L9 [Thermodesulfobacteriota bacterium]